MMTIEKVLNKLGTFSERIRLLKKILVSCYQMMI